MKVRLGIILLNIALIFVFTSLFSGRQSVDYVSDLFTINFYLIIAMLVLFNGLREWKGKSYDVLNDIKTGAAISALLALLAGIPLCMVHMNDPVYPAGKMPQQHPAQHTP